MIVRTILEYFLVCCLLFYGFITSFFIFSASVLCAIFIIYIHDTAEDWFYFSFYLFLLMSHYNFSIIATTSTFKATKIMNMVSYYIPIPLYDKIRKSSKNYKTFSFLTYILHGIFMTVFWKKYQCEEDETECDNSIKTEF